MNLDKNLRYYRNKAGYKTAKEFADALDIPYNTYTAYENQKREPKLEMLCKIADLLQISIDDLLGRTSKSEDEILELNIKDILKSNGFLKGVLSGLEKIKIEFISIDKNDIHFNFCINDKQINDVSLSKQEIINEFNSIDEKSEIDKNLKKKNAIYLALSKYIEQLIDELEKDNKSLNDKELLLYREAQLTLFQYVYPEYVYPKLLSKVIQELSSENK